MRPVLCPELPEDSLDVHLHGGFLDIQQGGDFLVRMAGRQGAKDLQFPLAEGCCGLGIAIVP